MGIGRGLSTMGASIYTLEKITLGIEDDVGALIWHLTAEGEGSHGCVQRISGTGAMNLMGWKRQRQ